jgi:hypothetical protein
VDHHHDVGTPFERRPVAGLLISAVAAVAGVPDHAHSQRLSHLDRLIAAGIVNQQKIVHDLSVEFTHCALQRQCGVVSR